MLNREETIRQMKECMNKLEDFQICALFLLSVERTGQSENIENLIPDGIADRAANVLSRFFWIKDTVGYLGENRFAAFLTGRLTERTIWDKAETLSQTLWFAAEDIPAENLTSYIGVYLFQAGGDSFSHAFRMAEYALSLARKEKNRNFYICTALSEEKNHLPQTSAGLSTQLMLNYIDEGVRLLKVGETIKPLYISPGFLRRLNLEGEKAENCKVHIHPADLAEYEQKVYEAAKGQQPVEGMYRISRSGKKWIACAFRMICITSYGQGPVVLEISHNMDGIEQLKGQLDEKQQWLRFVARQTEYQLWEVDIKTRTFRFLYTRNLVEGRQAVYENFPESVIQCGRVHVDSAARFRKFAKDMYGGKAEDTGNFMVQYRQSSCYGWAAIAYHMLYDAAGQPDKAIGIKEELSYLPSQQSRMIQRRIVPAGLYPYLYCFIQANITANVVEKFQLNGREQIDLIRCLTYDDVVDQRLADLFLAEDQARIKKDFARMNLLAEFSRGRYWFYDRCRVVAEDGLIRWVRVGVNLSADPETKDVCLFAYTSHREQRHQWENTIGGIVETDPVTGIYRAKTMDAITRYLLSSREQKSCALAVIVIGGADQLFAGKQQMQKEKDIITALHVFLDTDCVVGEETGSSILAFFPEVKSKTALRQKLENAFYYTRMSLSGVEEMKYLRFTAGVVWSREYHNSYDVLVRTAASLCTMHSSDAMDSVNFSEDYSWNIMEVTGRGDSMVESKSEAGIGAMTGREKDVAMECMGVMLKLENVDNALQEVLSILGRYYSADRLYILALTENGRTVTMLYEWMGEGKYSIQHSITGKPTERFPVISKYAKSTSPVILSANKNTEEGKRLSGKNVWQYAIFPMGRVNHSNQLLCVENPRNDITNRTALLETLIPYLNSMSKRLGATGKADTPIDRYFALQNLNAYLEQVYSINSDTCSCLGVLAVDIPDFSAMKDQLGYEYGQSLLLCISEAMIHVFGIRMLFHTKEAELIALCPDITYETFLIRCTRVRQLIGRKYSGKFRDGCTWADKCFNGQNLVNKARAIMKCSGYYGPGWGGLGKQENGAEKTVREDMLPDVGEEGRFTIYLQPKIDMRTGKLMGAEALVRILDKNGDLVPHARIIEDMEKEGTIQKLDYFVFNKMLETLNRWQERGYAPITVSSNFSRNTLLNPSSLASVLAILSHYPGIPQDLIELEITETAGDFENNTFSELIRRFSSYGLQFSLDDFGSSYSNMSMLANLHFHSVKLDRSMISNILTNSVSMMMVKNIIKICDSCGMACIAEGVETELQANALLDNGCRHAQGYYYGRPMPVHEFERKYFNYKTEDEV